MQRINFGTRAPWLAVVVAATLTSACGLEKQTQPSLIGPAQTGLAINLTATPDSLPRDGSSQEVVTFDGSCHPSNCSSSGVTDEGSACNSCTFTWSFGGDGTASGQIVTHAFSGPGTFVVTETVRDAGGLTAVAQRSVIVNSLTIPTALSISVSPNPPISQQAATFTPSAAVAAHPPLVSHPFLLGAR